MKNQRRPRGLGVHAIDGFLTNIMAHQGGSVGTTRNGLCLSTPGRTDPVSVLYNPVTPADWATRLEWVEKQAAIFLLNAPVVFSLKDVGRRSSLGNSRWLRLSFGLSLSVGPPLSKRFVCALEHGKSIPHVGTDSPLGAGYEAGSSVPCVPAWASKDIPKLVQGIVAGCERFKESPEVRDALVEVGRARRTELTYLDQLYRRKQGINDRLYGRAGAGTEGSDSIASEFRSLQAVVIQRYAVRIRVQLLTLGIFEGYAFPLENTRRKQRTVTDTKRRESKR